MSAPSSGTRNFHMIEAVPERLEGDILLDRQENGMVGCRADVMLGVRDEARHEGI